MHSKEYMQYANVYNKLITEISLYAANNDEEKQFNVFYIETLQLNLLTKMALLEYEQFEYNKEINEIFNDFLNWINNKINFMPVSNTKMDKGYDKYLLATILLDDDCKSYWHSKIKKEFKFFFKKISHPIWISRWVINAAEYAEEKGLYSFSYLFTRNALTIFNIHNELSDSIQNGLMGCYTRGKANMK